LELSKDTGIFVWLCKKYSDYFDFYLEQEGKITPDLHLNQTRSFLFGFEKISKVLCVSPCLLGVSL